MGQRNKGGMWCDYCQRPVLAVKNTHRLRNAVSMGGVMATSGASLLGIKVQGYRCPTCGGHVRAAHGSGRANAAGQTNADPLRAFILLVALVALAGIWVLLVVAAGLLLAVVIPVRLVGRRSPTSVERAMREAPKKLGAIMGRLSKTLNSPLTKAHPGPVGRSSTQPKAVGQSSNGAPSTVGIGDELGKLAALRDAGILTPQEFETQKAKLLS